MRGRNRFNRYRLILFFLSLSFFDLYQSTPTEASCGLSHCTLVGHAQTAPSWQGVNLFRATDDPNGALYFENFFGLGWKPLSDLNLMLLVPAVYIEGSALGLGNSIVQVDYQWDFKNKGIAIGIQGELPTSSQEQYGDRHSVALPYVRGWWKQKQLSTQIQLGFAQTLEFGHHTHGTPHMNQDQDHHNHDHDHSAHHNTQTQSTFMMNPHASSEVLVRMQAQWTPMAKVHWIELVGGLDGIQEMVDQKDTIIHALFGLQSSLSWGRLQAIALVPMSDHKRFNQRLLLSLNVPFGKISKSNSQSGSSLLASY